MVANQGEASRPLHRPAFRDRTSDDPSQAGQNAEGQTLVDPNPADRSVEGQTLVDRSWAGQTVEVRTLADQKRADRIAVARISADQSPPDPVSASTLDDLTSARRSDRLVWGHDCHETGGCHEMTRVWVVEPIRLGPVYRDCDPRTCVAPACRALRTAAAPA